MFKVNQKVWCAIYGEGVVTEIRHEGTTYPVVAVFNCNGECTATYATYTNDGKYHEAGNVTLFPHPVEIVKAVTKPSIDWSHVSEDFQYLAMDSSGVCYLYSGKPSQGESQWVPDMLRTSTGSFASFISGTCDWRDSLVKRPN